MNAPDLDPRSGQLADRLARRADTIDLGPPVVDVVMARGHQRRRRRQTAAGVAAVAGVCTASVVAIATLSRPSSEGSIVAAPAGTDAATGSTITGPVETAVAATIAGPVDTLPAAPIATVGSPFVWNRVDPASSEAVSLFWGGPEQFIAGDGPFVAWSTAPGVTDRYEPVLWRSDDGIRWQEVTGAPAVGSRAVAERDGRFFVYGTTPALASSGRLHDVSISTSDDGGRTWSTDVLPIDTGALAAEPGVRSVSVNATSMASSPAGVLVSVTVTPVVDVVELLPEAYRNSPWEFTDEGVLVTTGGCAAPVTTMVLQDGAVVSTTVPGSTTPLDTVPTACSQELIAWADLGVSDVAARAMRSPETRMFVSVDGDTFDEVSAPVELNGWYGLRLAPLGDGFAALSARFDDSGVGTWTLWTSADGRAWTDAGAVPITNVESLASGGGRLAVTGWDEGYGRQVIALRDASGTWTTTDLAGFIRPDDGKQVNIFASHVVLDETGVSVIASLNIDPIAEMGGTSFGRDGITVFIDDSSWNLRVVDDATGEQLARVDPSGAADTELVRQRPDDGVWEVRRESGGEIVTTFSYQDLEGVMSDAFRVPSSKLLLLHSADGVTWSRDSLSDIAGAPVSSSGGVRVAGNQLIVAANLRDERNPDGSAKQVVLIATPAA